MQNTSYTPLGETEALHARQSEESDAWESRIRYDERGREIERFATGGVRITSEYDFAGRLEARCTYAGTESRGHRFYAWRRNDRLLSMRSHLRKSPVMPQPKDWLDKLFTRTTPNDKELRAHYGWQQGDIAYEWYGNGMLKSVRTPEGATIRFEYDALGRRTLKETHDTCHRYAWDSNVLLHEWSYDRPEPYCNLITWVYDGGSYTPVAKLTEEDRYTIVQDYLGTLMQALDSKGNVVWDCILDIYGDILELRGERNFIPFRFQGQYEDGETGLYYNRYRYNSPETATYISQDPIRLAGANPTLYGYVFDPNTEIDPFGLDCGKATVNMNNKSKTCIAENHLNHKGNIER